MKDDRLSYAQNSAFSRLLSHYYHYSQFDLVPEDRGGECLPNVGDTVHSKAPSAGLMTDHRNHF